MDQLTSIIDFDTYPIRDRQFQQDCADALVRDGVLTLPKFITPATIAALITEAEATQDQAYYTASTHNVYLSKRDNALGDDHVFKRCGARLLCSGLVLLEVVVRFFRGFDGESVLSPTLGLVVAGGHDGMCATTAHWDWEQTRERPCCRSPAAAGPICGARGWPNRMEDWAGF